MVFGILLIFCLLLYLSLCFLGMHYADNLYLYTFDHDMYKIQGTRATATAT